MGVQGKSIATAALGYAVKDYKVKSRLCVTSERLQGCKRKALNVTNLKAQEDICTFHLSVKNVNFYDGNEKGKPNNFICNLRLII